MTYYIFKTGLDLLGIAYNNNKYVVLIKLFTFWILIKLFIDCCKLQLRNFLCHPLLFLNKMSIFQVRTDGCNIVTIPALAYLINYLYSQRSGRGRSESTFFKVGEVFNKICPLHYANFRKKISSETSCGMS